MKYWVFDLDGTLVDSLTTHFKVLKVVFENQGVGFSEADHHDVLKVSAKTLSDYFELKFGKEKLESALLHFFELSHAKMESIKAFDGIEKLLQTLQSQGHKRTSSEYLQGGNFSKPAQSFHSPPRCHTDLLLLARPDENLLNTASLLRQELPFSLAHSR